MQIPCFANLRALINIRRRRIKRLATQRGRLGFKVFHHLGHIRCHRNLGALWLVFRNEHADGAVVAHQITFRRSSDALGRDRINRITHFEQIAPVADGDEFRHADTDGFVVVQHFFKRIGRIAFDPVDFFFGRRIVFKILDARQ